VIRVVFDTNLFVSALVFGGPPEELFMAATSGAFQLYSSTPLLADLLEVPGERFSWPAPLRVRGSYRCPPLPPIDRQPSSSRGASMC
jgi:hypothetical protein